MQSIQKKEISTQDCSKKMNHRKKLYIKSRKSLYVHKYIFFKVITILRLILSTNDI